MLHYLKLALRLGLFFVAKVVLKSYAYCDLDCASFLMIGLIYIYFMYVLDLIFVSSVKPKQI